MSLIVHLNLGLGLLVDLGDTHAGDHHDCKRLESVLERYHKHLGKLGAQRHLGE